MIAASAGIGADAGVGLALGVAVYENTKNIDGSNGGAQGEVKAYVTASSVWADGLLDVQATSSERVEAEVIAASAAISGGSTGVALAGSGTTVINNINVLTKADVDGGANVATSTTTIVAGAVAVDASDTAVIDAEADAVAVAAAFGAGVGFAGAIGSVDRLENTIIDPVFGGYFERAVDDDQQRRARR